MSASTDLLVTNRTATTSKTSSLYDMGEVSNYAISQNGKRATLDNTTVSGMGTKAERIMYSSKDVPKVNMDIPVPYKQKTGGAVLYGTDVQDIIRHDDGDGNFTDIACRVTINIAHDKSPFLTEALVEEVLNRAYSSLQHANGDWRLDELAQGKVSPVSN